MVKKIYALIALSFISMTAFGMSINELNSQLIHLQAQLKAVKLSWQRAELTLRQAQKLNLVLYHQTQSDAKDILAREEIITKMDELVKEQAEAIINNRMPYKAINFLAECCTEQIAKMQPYLRLVITAMANREFRSLLGKRLASKEKELIIAIKASKTREDGAFSEYIQ
jgi:hypothetical protein